MAIRDLLVSKNDNKILLQNVSTFVSLNPIPSLITFLQCEKYTAIQVCHIYYAYMYI